MKSDKINTFQTFIAEKKLFATVKLSNNIMLRHSPASFNSYVQLHVQHIVFKFPILQLSRFVVFL